MERITLNLIPKGITPICHASQYDTGRQIALDLMDDLQGYTLNDETIELGVCKPDGNIVTAAVEVTSGKTYVIIETTEQMTACEGDSECELKISKDGTVIGTLNFKLRVERDPLKDGIESETVIHNLNTMVEEMVAEEVATQYDSGNVIFDPSPVQGHGNGYTVTSEGIGTALDKKQDLIATKSASGDLITISDGGDNIPMKSCEITIEPDLTGHTEANLVVCGKNLLPSYNLSGSGTLTINSNNGVYSISGTASSYMNIIASDSFFLKSGTYTLNNINNGNSNIKAQLRSVDGQTTYANSATASNTFTLNETTEVKFRFAINAGTYNETCKPELEIGNEANTFNQYNGTTYNIPFGQTIYGGSGNMLTGEFESTFGFVEFDGSNDEDWHLSSTYDWNVYINIPTSKPLQFGDMLLCKAGNNLVPTTPSGYIEENKCNISTNRNFQIGILGTLGITTLEDWRTWLSSNHIKVAFTLETPTSLTLSGVTPKTISGVNNIYNDCGQTAIEYFPNTVDGFVTLIKDYNVTDATELPISDSDPTNTKAYIDSGLSGKADSSNVYPKTDVYTKTEVNNLLGWEYINTIVDNGATADISNYETIIALPLANGTNKYNPYTIWKSMLSGTISLTMFRSNSYYWTGTLTLTGDTLSVTNNELTGWTSVTVAIYGKKS